MYLMKLRYQEEIEEIENCPVTHEKGNRVFYRWIKDHLNEESFEPHAILHNGRFKNLCEGWGISLFISLSAAKEVLNNLPPKKRLQYKSIAKGEIFESEGIKYYTKNEKHYTFFPKDDIDLVSKFMIVEDDK